MAKPVDAQARMPYRVLVGLVPCGAGWLGVSAKLVGVHLSPERCAVYSSLEEVLEQRPAFSTIALACPVGLPGRSGHRRGCDVEARRLLGWPRGAAVIAPPSRDAIRCDTYEEARSVSTVPVSPLGWQLKAHLADVDETMATYLQRTVFEAHPEISFHLINGDRRLQHSRGTEAGDDERRSLLLRRMPGIERAFDSCPDGVRIGQVYDAAACLWTARRVEGKSILRIPANPEWDDRGLRMEIVR